jgi:hypothetical protein
LCQTSEEDDNDHHEHYHHHHLHHHEELDSYGSPLAVPLTAAGPAAISGGGGQLDSYLGKDNLEKKISIPEIFPPYLLKDSVTFYHRLAQSRGSRGSLRYVVSLG